MGPVLLVDSHTKTLRSWCDALKPTGITFVAALSEAEAEEYLQTFEVSVIVSGHHQHGLDAPAMFRLARRMRPLVRGILCTGNIDAGDAIAAAQFGFDDIIFLPWSAPRVLAASVTTSLAINSTWQERLDEFSRPSAPIYWQSVGFAHPGTVTTASR